MRIYPESAIGGRRILKINLKQITVHIKQGWLNEAIPVFILAGLAVFFFSDVIFGSRIFIHRDLLRFFYPLREFSVTQFKAFQCPLWNPYIHCGSPHLAELQTCVFYPLSIIYQFFSYARAFNLFIITHVFLAGWFTYLLMREWGYSRYAAFLSALAFMLSGYIISVINLLASLASVIWLPLVILFYDRALKRDWVKDSIITGIFLALMLLGGEPAILLGTVFILVILGGWRVLDSAPAAHRSNNILRAKSRRILLPLVLSLIILAGLSCFQILPFFEFLGHSSRPAMDFSEASMWSLPPYALIDLFVPYLSETDYLYKDYWNRQSWLLVYYMGLFTIICAFIALKFDTTGRRKAFFYILALGLVLSFGRYTPLYYFLYKFLPGFSLTRYPIKFFFMVAFSLAILAGMGLDYYIRKINFSTRPQYSSSNVEKNIAVSLEEYSGLRRFTKGMLISALILGFLYLVLNFESFNIFNALYKNMSPFFLDKRPELNQLIYVAIFNVRRAIGYFMLLSAAIFIGASRKIKLNLIIPFLLFVSIVDIYTGNKKLYLNMDINEYVKPGDTVEFLSRDKSLYRIFVSPAALSQNMFVPEKDYFEGVHALKERLVSNRGVGFGIYDAYGYGSLYKKRHEGVIKLITQSDLPDDTNLLNLLNVKYVISPKGFIAKGYELVKKGEKANIYENKNVLPRVFLADKAVVIKDEAEILDRMKDKDFNPAEEVILEEVLDSAPAAHRSNNILRASPSASLGINSASREEYSEIIKYSPNEVIIEAQLNTPKFLVLSDSYYPGWKAYADNRQWKIYRANYILRAVYLEPGRHIVRFTYAPFSFKIGVIVTLLIVIVITILTPLFSWIKKSS